MEECFLPKWKGRFVIVKETFNSASVRSVDRALDIIEQLSVAEKPLGPTRLAEKTGMDKSTVYRLLSTLQRRGYVDKLEGEGTYHIGQKLIALTSNYIGNLELQTEAKPYLSALATDLGLTTHLGVLDGRDVIYIEKLENMPTPQLYSQIGTRMPAYCSSLGKCLLANLRGDELDELMASCHFEAFTPHTIVSLYPFKEHLRQVRSQGWALDNEESALGHMCVGAPIYDYRGEIIAAVSASGAKENIPEHYLPVVIDAVKKTALQISRRMGYLL